MSGATQPSRDELLALGRQKLQAFQQARGKAPPSTSASASLQPSLPADPASTARSSLPLSNGHSHAPPPAHAPSLPFPSLASPPSELPSVTPRRDLFPFLDAAANAEPSTPPSSSFHSSASFADPSLAPDPTPDPPHTTTSSLLSPHPPEPPTSNGYDDPSSVQYYLDSEQGLIFYYDDQQQPVYLPASYQPQPPPPSSNADDTSALHQKLADYEAYIAQLQASLVSSSASPLPALQTLTHELSLAQAESESLRGQLRSLQGEVASKGQAVSELMEDNVRLMEEYEAVCEELRAAEESLVHSSSRPPSSASPIPCEHSDLLHTLQADAAEMERAEQHSRRLMDALRVQWRDFLTRLQSYCIPSYRPSPVLAPTAASLSLLAEELPSNYLSPYPALDKPMAADTLAPSNPSSMPPTPTLSGKGPPSSQADWAALLEVVDRLSTLLAGKEDVDQQVSMHAARMRQLLDPVALLLSPASTASPLSSSERSLPSSPAAEPASAASALLADLQSARQAQQEMREQLQHQQERASSLIRDKLMLAKRIEAAYEEKAALEVLLREALVEVGKEKEEYRQKLEGVGRQDGTQDSVAAQLGRYATPPVFALPPPALEPPAASAKPKGATARTARERRVRAQRRGLLSSLLSLLFGGGGSSAEVESDTGEAADGVEGRVVMV